MASLQNSVFNFIVKNVVAPQLTVTSPLDRQRVLFNWFSKICILPFQTKSRGVLIGHIPATWISVGEFFKHQTILYLHGGAFTMGSSHTHLAATAYLSKYSATHVLSVDYRLAPEYPYPAALADAKRAYKWLLENQFPPENIVIAGDSAGGGLVIATLLALRDSGLPLPAGAVCLSPWADLACMGETFSTKMKEDPLLTSEWLHWMAKHYAGSHDLKTPMISPVYGDLYGLPPLFIQVGSKEILLSDAYRLVENANKSGTAARLTVLNSVCHSWSLCGGVIPEAKQAFQEAGLFIRGILGR